MAEKPCHSTLRDQATLSLTTGVTADRGKARGWEGSNLKRLVPTLVATLLAVTVRGASPDDDTFEVDEGSG